MSLDDIARIISQVGFPIFVAAYLLIRVETLIRMLVEMEKVEQQILTEMRQSLDRLSR